MITRAHAIGRHHSPLGVSLLAAVLCLSGCYGPFNLTRRLYRWNAQVGTKWEREFMFVILAWAPVYGLAVLGDALVFNAMEFWTGNNPVDPPGKTRSDLPRTKRIARGDAEAFLEYRTTSDGPHLIIRQFQRGKPAGTLHIERRHDTTVGLDAEGNLLLSAQSMPDGSLAIHDETSQQVIRYSAADVDGLSRLAAQEHE